MRRIGFFFALSALCVCGLGHPASAITVRPVTAAALKNVIAQHRGHVVLVNFWATWCIPCMKEFPDLVQVSRADAAKGLVVLAVSGDKPHDITSRVAPFLASRHATFPQYIINGDLDTFVNGFQPQWQADFPQTFLFNAQGKLVREMQGQQSLAAWQAALAPLWGKSKTR